MAPRAAAGVTAAGGPRGKDGRNIPADSRWVTVSWMPHTTLAQTSHVCFSIRSAHAVIDRLQTMLQKNNANDNMNDNVSEWKVRIGAYAIGGLPLALSSLTPTSTVQERRGGRKSYNNNNVNVDDVLQQQQQQQQLRPSVSNATHDCFWDQFIQIPVRWRDLPRDAYLLFEIMGCGDRVIYEATMPFFSRYGKLTTGLRKIELHEPSSASAASNQNPGVFPLRPRNEVNAPSAVVDNDGDDDPVWKASCVLDQLERFEEDRARQPPPLAGSTSAASAGAHHRQLPSSPPPSFGQIPSVPWLDALTKERASQILAAANNEATGIVGEEYPVLPDPDKPPAYLIVEFPTFEIPIMHEEAFYPTPHQGASGGVTTMDLAVYQKQQRRKENKSSDYDNDNSSFDPLQLVPFLDYEDEADNPVEDKYRTLAHDLLRGLVDPNLKPDRAQRDQLAAIIDSPSHHPTREEKDLLWRFRFSLVDNRRALTKFLLAVDWSVDSEVVQAVELLEQWRRRSPIEVTDALKLLGKHVAFQTSLVRTYAIETLQAAPDSELRLYLLQLVQALKYETTDTSADHAQAGVPASQSSSLSTFLINRAAGNIGLANFLYWYLKVELNNPTHGARYQEVFAALEAKLSDTPFVEQGAKEAGESSKSKSSSKSFKSIVDTVSSKFRSDVGSESSAKKKSKSRTMWAVLVAQDEFISGILDIQERCRDARGKKDIKEEQLRSLLAKEGYDKCPTRDPIPLPSAPDIFVNGVHPETAKMFKSALYPAVVDFYVSKTHPGDGHSEHMPPSSCKVMVKSGDDLRQDQLIIMMIQLMDGLLNRAALNLCLTPYSILAMSPNTGLVEFVDGAVPISVILSEHNGSIMQFFQAMSPQNGAKYGVRPDVMSTYIRSVAGYCVITYILGVGDRHLDNILLRSSGHFMHIDFGFIFGRDPKPLPPAFRLTREMVDGMGGTDSSEYRQFCSLACQAFNALRKSAGLVLNLLHLMSDAGIEDLSNNPSADAEGVITKVEERFRLDLNDEQAERYFIGLINDCLAALAPRVMDVFHSFSVARR